MFSNNHTFPPLEQLAPPKDPHASWLLKGEAVLFQGKLQPAALWIDDARICAIIQEETLPESLDVIDAGATPVLPGLVDTHVHINEPGRTDWEGFETATQAALAGGITTVVDMPLNCIPVTTSVSALEEKLQAVTGKLHIDCGFYGGIVPGNTAQIRPLIEAGVLGFKAFLCPSGIDDFPNVTEANLREAMQVLQGTGVRLLVHAELESAFTPAHSTEPETHYNRYLSSRPAQWEVAAIQLMIQLCETYRVPVHIVHLSAADALPMIAEAKDRGLPITAETCPHYLCLASEHVADKDTRFKCAPPIREQENQDRLWKGLEDGIIDFIVSDHSPCLPSLKNPDTGNFLTAWGGISSLQFGLPLIWTEAKRRSIKLETVAAWLSEKPARWLGLSNKGHFHKGAQADAVLFSPSAPTTLSRDSIRYRHPITPYEGRELSGSVMQTLFRGQLDPTQQALGHALLKKDAY